jgi:histidinol-phosphate/aromatic aminotransferase/cobyric acid decarboxylase-like protein
MSARGEKGGGAFEGIKLLLCENPLPPLDEAIEAARAELGCSNYYTEPYSAPLRRLIAAQDDVPERLVHINAGSELILRQVFQRLGQRVHLLTPTYALFPEVAASYTETRLQPGEAFRYDLGRLEVPDGTSLVVIVNPNNPNGATHEMGVLDDLLRRQPKTYFLVDEAFIGLAGESVGSWGWARDLATALHGLGVRVFPSETYFFLADFSPHDAEEVARRLAERNILVKPLGDRILGRGYMRVTTALPGDNERFIAALAPILGTR